MLYAQKKPIPPMIAPRLSKYLDIHKGQRCFICATGPSLNRTPVQLLPPDEVIIGVNSFYKHPAMKRAQYLCVIDPSYWNKYNRSIKKACKETSTELFVSYIRRQLKDESLVYIPPRPNSGGRFTEHDQRFRLMPDWNKWGDMRYGIYQGYTVVALALQMAYHMGFNEVYLLGCDCHYRGDKVHHFDGSKVDFYWRQNWEPVFVMYRICKKVFEKSGRKIYNSTEGGALEIFERVPFHQFCRKTFC